MKVSEQPEGVKDIMEESVKGSGEAAKAWAEIFLPIGSCSAISAIAP